MGTLKSAYIKLLAIVAASQTVYLSVYNMELFISYFVISMCVINVLRFENRLKSLESALFLVKIRVFIVQERNRENFP